MLRLVIQYWMQVLILESQGFLRFLFWNRKELLGNLKLEKTLSERFYDYDLFILITLNYYLGKHIPGTTYMNTFHLIRIILLIPFLKKLKKLKFCLQIHWIVHCGVYKIIKMKWNIWKRFIPILVIFLVLDVLFR